MPNGTLVRPVKSNPASEQGSGKRSLAFYKRTLGMWYFRANETYPTENAVDSPSEFWQIKWAYATSGKFTVEGARRERILVDVVTSWKSVVTSHQKSLFQQIINSTGLIILIHIKVLTVFTYDDKNPIKTFCHYENAWGCFVSQCEFIYIYLN